MDVKIPMKMSLLLTMSQMFQTCIDLFTLRFADANKRKVFIQVGYIGATNYYVTSSEHVCTDRGVVQTSTTIEGEKDRPVNWRNF